MDRYIRFIALLINVILVFGVFKEITAQGNSGIKLNILYVNEENNPIADEALNIVKEQLATHTEINAEFHFESVIATRENATATLDALCSKYSSMLESTQSPHLVIDTTMTGYGSETVKSFTKALGLPTMSASFGQEGDLRQWRDITTDMEDYLIQINPPADIIPEIVRIIVLNQNISNAAILFDDTFVMDHKYKSLLQNIATRHVITAISDESIENQLERLNRLDLKNYFILGSLANIKRVLNAADNKLYFDRTYAWHAITLEHGDLKCNCRNATVMFVKPKVERTYEANFANFQTIFSAKPDITAAFYYDFILDSLMTIKDIVGNGTWTKDDNGKYITCDDYDSPNDTPKRTGIKIKTYFNGGNPFPPSYGPIKIERNGYSFMDFVADVFSVYIKEGLTNKTTALGTWRSSYNEKMELLYPDEMSNFTAAVIYSIATVIQKPFIVKNDAAPRGFEGYCIDLMDKIAKEVQFDYTIYAVDDDVFGNMDKDGNWNGAVKELLDKRAQIALGSMSVMAERESVIDFTVPYYDLVGFTILMKKPETPTSLFKFLTVLENDVWLCILAAYLFTSFLMWVFDRWSPYSYQNNKEKYIDDEEKREFNLKECLWFCMTSLTPQGGGEAPKNLSGRLVAATWWLFGFIIIASYTANLAAFLTVSRLDSVVESLDDLSKQYKIQYAPLNGSDTMVYFQRMANIEQRFYNIWKDMSLNDSLSEYERAQLAVWDYPVSDKYSKMWQAMQEAGLPNTLEEAIDRVKASKSQSEGFAFIGDATDVRYLELTNCNLQMVGEEFSRKPYAIAVQQGSPLKDQFNTAILNLLNKRDLERLKEVWWNNNKEAKVCEKQEDQSDGISIQNIGGVFIVIFVGIGLACITLAFEYWWYKYRKGSKITTVQEAHKTPKVANLPKPIMRGSLMEGVDLKSKRFQY